MTTKRQHSVWRDYLAPWTDNPNSTLDVKSITVDTNNIFKRDYIEATFRSDAGDRGAVGEIRRIQAKAVADAREKAEILARSAGLTLKEIASVDYSYGGADAFVRPTARIAAFKAADAQSFAFVADMNPDDVNVSDTVTVVWETV